MSTIRPKKFSGPDFFLDAGAEAGYFFHVVTGKGIETSVWRPISMPRITLNAPDVDNSRPEGRGLKHL
jgi:hypothetical protein